MLKKNVQRKESPHKKQNKKRWFLKEHMGKVLSDNNCTRQMIYKLFPFVFERQDCVTLNKKGIFLSNLYPFRNNN